MFATDKKPLLATTCPAPGCAVVGSAVPASTIATLLTDEAKKRLGNPEGFRFCPSAGCEIVYWNPASGARFTKNDLRVRVGVKETTGPRPVCYCFNFAAEDIERDVRETGGSPIPDEIRKKVRAGLCFCEKANPQGTCCLGNVRAVLKTAQESAGAGADSDQRRDLLAVAWARGLWALAVAMGVVGAFFELGRPMLWSLGFGLGGTLCVVNALRSRRLHCIVTGPVFLAGAIASALRWSGLFETPRVLVGGGVLLGTVLPCLAEFLSGRTYAGGGGSGDCCGPGLPRTLRVPSASTLSALGAVIAAVLGSACCWLPLLLIAFGVSAGTVSGVLGEHRVAFLGVSVLLLALSFYSVYRKPGCRPDGTCSSPSPRIERFNKVTVWIATVVVAAAAAFPSLVGSVFSARSAMVAASDEEATYTVEGMTCESCALSLRAELEQLPGVGEAEVSFETKTVKIHGKRDAHLPPDDLTTKTIQRAGFEARRIPNH